MLGVLLQMFALIGVGLLWSWWQPGRLETEASRKVLVGSVYYLFLPALVLVVLWRAPLGVDTVKIVLAAAGGVLGALAVSFLACRVCRADPRTAGAMILAASWPNATYLGLPVLENTLGAWARTVAIQYDLFACTPLLLSVGILIASAHGAGGRRENPLKVLFTVPPFWAALAALAFNLGGVPVPEWIDGFLRLMGAAVVPLMLVSVGMALRQGFGQLRHLPLVIPVAVIQLFVMPLIVFGAATALGLAGEMRIAVVLEAAMPSMVLGIVLADRYGLNAGVYAAALTTTTLLSLFTLPLWFDWAGGPG
ncbi:transporter [Sulfurifustis variabilis]|uniref:Transporter n=1 Tax=Sulfurifustis variabilis TaxID=1675686 RepID=A0A1B4V343_9GAMM|nr:AEC family transporter [Sulfurifustis variabilis]BAU46892.1 transporter [Sulfurifustis variabilis]